jgi:hypothetical protein
MYRLTPNHAHVGPTPRGRSYRRTLFRPPDWSRRMSGNPTVAVTFRGARGMNDWPSALAALVPSGWKGWTSSPMRLLSGHHDRAAEPGILIGLLTDGEP